MKQNTLKALKFTTLFILGILLFWWVYKDQDIDHIYAILSNEVNYFWIGVSIILGLMSHVSRTIRWNLMIEPLGHKPRLLNTFLAVMIGYLMNLALPRMGEISRCGILSRYEKISFTKLIGTVVLERLIDMLMLLILLLVVIFTQFGQLIEFLNNNPEVQEKLIKILRSPFLPVAFVLFLALVWLARHKIKASGIAKKFIGLFHQFTEGFKSIRDIRNKGAFVFHSVFIWFLYYVMLYCVFFSFGFTSHLTALAGLTVFVLGSFGMVAPVQGGIGAWHFMVIEGLALYGVEKTDGQVFALLAHGSTTVVLIVVGAIALLALPFVNENRDSDAIHN